MAGKAPPSRSRKDRARTARPYDRPNQSILGKVASTVRGLFTPSWLFNVSSWVRTNTEEEDITVNAENTIEPDLTENEDEPEVPSITQRTTGRFKRSRTDCGPSAITTPEAPYWLGPSTSRHILPQNIDRPSASSTVIPDCEPVRKEIPITLNGDDHSENSDGSASTSGCSSLVSSQDKPHRSSGLKLSDAAIERMQGELKRNPLFQRQRKEAATLTTNEFFTSPCNTSQGNTSLWSCGTQTPGRSPQIPSLLNSSRPSFNISSFGGVSKGNTPNSKTASPFYDGNTTFGGASAYRRRQLNSMPYQLNQSAKSMRCQIKVSSSNKELECMSSAAKRILHTLETMSTPITDAKKIPNVTKSPLDIPFTLTPPNHRLKSYLPLTRNSPAGTPKGPPIVNLNSVTKLSLLKNQRGRMRNSLMELPLREQPMVSLPAECTVNKSQDSSDISMRISGDNSSSNNPITSSGGGGGGKMRSKLREPLHTSSKAKSMEEPVPEVDLPSIPLPISSLPTFSFASKDIPKHSSTRSTENKKENRFNLSNSSNINNITPFTFSSPIEYIPPTVKAQDVSKGDVFKFSSPLVVSPKIISTKKKEEPTEIYSDRSINDILKKLNDKAGAVNKKEDLSKSRQGSSSGEAKDAAQDGSNRFEGFGDKFKPKPGSWSCTSCLLPNDESRDSCISCSTAKSSYAGSTSGITFKNTASNSSKDKKTDDKSGCWKCALCSTENKQSLSKCSVCELSNSAFASKSNASGLFMKRKLDDSSEKPKISIANDISASPKISTSNTITVSTFGGKLFQNNDNTWECDACMVRNLLDKAKCSACETLRPSKEKTAGKFTFVSKTALSSPSLSDKSVAEPFKTSETEPLPNYQKPSFTFGASLKPLPEASSESQTTGSQSTAPAFSFGNPAPLKTKGFQFGSRDEPSLSTFDSKAPEATKTSTVSDSGSQKPGLFVFGATSQKESTPSTGGFSFGNSTVPLPSAATDSISTKPREPTPKEPSDAKQPALFNFGAPSKTEDKPSLGGFAFKSSTDDNPLLQPQVSFGGFKMPTSVATTSSSSGFTFGSSTVPSAGGFVFGATTTTTSATPISSSRISVGFGDTLKPTLASWTCTKCQGKNEASKDVCCSCNSPKVSLVLSADETRTNTGFGDKFKPEPGAWECSSCMLGNTINTNKCVACETPKPAQKKPAVSFTSDLTKNNPSSGIATNPLTGNIFQSRSGTWECGTCMVPNALDKSKCGACETPRLANTMAAPSQNLMPSVPAVPSVFSFGASAPAASTAFSFGAGTVTLPVLTGTAKVDPTKATIAEAVKSSIMEPPPSYQKPPALFTFGAATNPETKTTGGFAFKSSTEEKPAPMFPQPQVNFGGFKMATGGTNPVGATPAPGFNLLAGATPAAPSTGGFVFGTTTKTDSAPMSNTQFSFSASAKPAGFSCFQPNPPAVTSSMPTFAFGANTTNASTASAFNPPSAGGFSFAPKTQPSTLNPTPAPAAFGSPATQPVFGAPAFGSTASTPAFGSTTGTPSFGNVPAPKPASTGGFSFAPQTSDVFPSFGTLAEKKPAMTPAQGTGFNFMPSPAPAYESGNNFTAGFSMTAAPTFNFGATSTPTNQPFQFAASSEVNNAAAASSAPRKIRKAIRRGRKPV